MKPSKKDALMKTLLCETAAVIHVGEGGAPPRLHWLTLRKLALTSKVGNCFHEDQQHY